MNVRVKYGRVMFGYVNENVVVGLNVEWEFDCVSVSIVDDDVSVLCKLWFSVYEELKKEVLYLVLRLMIVWVVVVEM